MGRLSVHVIWSQNRGTSQNNRWSFFRIVPTLGDASQGEEDDLKTLPDGLEKWDLKYQNKAQDPSPGLLAPDLPRLSHLALPSPPLGWSGFWQTPRKGVVLFEAFSGVRGKPKMGVAPILTHARQDNE